MWFIIKSLKLCGFYVGILKRLVIKPRLLFYNIFYSRYSFQAETYTLVEKCNNSWWTLISIPDFSVGVNFTYEQKCIHSNLNTSRIHHNSKKRDWNLSPSKVVTFLYGGTCLCIHVYKEYTSCSLSSSSNVNSFFFTVLSWFLKLNSAAFFCNLANLFSYFETFFSVGLMLWEKLRKIVQILFGWYPKIWHIFEAFVWFFSFG